jgi:drug/metabolite transporter (DMT)-like permease
LLSILFGLSSALSWGGGDFMGGLASRKIGAYRAVMYAEAIGLLVLFGAAIFMQEPMLAWYKVLMALIAGAIGSFGLLVLYDAIATRHMSIAMPVSALLAAALPVIVGAFLEGFPPLVKFIGFACALAAVWMVAQDDSEKTQLMRLSDLRMPLFAGFCFGLYFILMHQAGDKTILWPMISSRSGGTLILLVFMLARRESWTISSPAWPLLIMNAALDVGGNAFYILAGQTGRLDVAAVISSLYPGVTVLLAAIVLKERINRLQGLGILAALVSIVLMTL